MKKIFNYFILYFLFTVSVNAQTTVFVSSSGDNNGDGSKDNPFKTIQKAIDIIKKSGADSSIIYVDGGNFFIDTTIVIDNIKNLILMPAKGEKVLLTGGIILNGFNKITEKDALYKRLDKTVKNKVYVLDLKKYDISDFGTFKARGFGLDMTASPMELYYNDKPMTIARWPDKDWIKIKNTDKKLRDNGFVYSDERPEKWKSVKDVWMHGYWKWDWADSYVKLDKLKKHKNIIIASSSKKKYPFTKDARYYYLNIPEELDKPGEYYINNSEGKLYFYPPDTIKKNSCYVSVLETPVIQLRDCENVKISGFNIKYSRGIGVEIISGKDNLIDNCVIANMGTVAVSIGAFQPNLGSEIYDNPLFTGNAGEHNGVSYCKIYHLGEGGVILGGGDRKSLTEGNNFVENCEIYRSSEWSRTYRAAVFMYGVGNKTAHNEIFNLPHTAIFFWGNEHLLEYNNIHHVCLETADAGAVYAGRDWTQRGNMIRYNYFHELHGVDSKHSFNAVMGVYLDDFCSGDTVYGNIFYKAGRSVLIGGGRDNLIKNNIFIENQPGVHVDARGIGWAKYYFTEKNPVLFNRYDVVKANKPPYSVKYPALLTLKNDDPQLPKYNCIEDNIFCGGKWRDMLDGLSDKIICFRNNNIMEHCTFYDVKNRRIYFNYAKIKLPEGFKPIPFDEIGIKKRTDQNTLF